MRRTIIKKNAFERGESMNPHHLPHQTTSFVGRIEELAQITTLLADPNCHLLTLLGHGGIGKTRLALAVADRIDSFPDGIYFIPLQSLGSSEHIISAIAGAVNFQFYPGGEPKQQLLSFLRNKQLLLLLDNFGHLLDGVDFVSDLLSTASMVQMIVTSRERLNLSSETVFQVSGLSVLPIRMPRLLWNSSNENSQQRRLRQRSNSLFSK
jgi:predicted ATPase